MNRSSTRPGSDPGVEAGGNGLIGGGQAEILPDLRADAFEDLAQVLEAFDDHGQAIEVADGFGGAGDAAVEAGAVGGAGGEDGFGAGADDLVADLDAGEYDVWVGSFAPDVKIDGVLTITNDSAQEPAVLTADMLAPAAAE